MWNFVNDKEVEEFGRQNVSVFVRKSNTVTLIVLSKGRHHKDNCRHFPNGKVCGFVCMCVTIININIIINIISTIIFIVTSSCSGCDLW